MTRRKKAQPEYVPGSPPDCLPKKLMAEFTELVERFTSAGHEPNDVERIILARFVLASEDLRTAEAAAADVPAVIETPSNGAQIHPAHRLVETRKRELRSWLKLLPKIAREAATLPRTSTPLAASSNPLLQQPPTPNPLLQPGITAPRAELLAKVRERLRTATAPEKRELLEAVRQRRAELAKSNPDTDGGSG
jgi:hypothetical protein